MSAKLLRVKQLQNQLTETQNQLNELVNENRLLRTLQKRQAVALQRFEGSQDQLPHLIKSHNEEIRVLTSKMKQLKEKCGDFERCLKRKDAELNYLKEHHKHLVQLSQDKQLVDRERLAKRVESLEAREKELTDKVQLLTRRLELEGKNYKHQLSSESSKLKETQNDLKSALGTINNLKAALEAKEKYVNCTMPKKYQKTMEHLMQNTHVSLPIPPRVSIRQPDKFSDSAHPNEEDSSSDSDVSYNKMFEDKNRMERDNREPNRIEVEKPYENSVGWSKPEQDSKPSSGNESKVKSGKGSNQSDDSLDGLKLNRIGEKKKKRLFTNVIGVGREMTANYMFGGKESKDRSGTRQSVKPRSRSLSKDSRNEAIRTACKIEPIKKGTRGRNYLADRESSSDEINRRDADKFEIASSLASFHQEMEYELDQVIVNGSAGVSPDNDSDEIFENCEPLGEPIQDKPAPTLEKYTKLSWKEMRCELPQSKEEILSILDQANPQLTSNRQMLDNEKKTNLLKALSDIDRKQDSLERTDQIIPDLQPSKVAKANKIHILQEIFKS